jgi:uncharacterized membrane protein
VKPVQAEIAELEALEGVAASIYRRVYQVLVAGMAVSTTLFAVGLLLAWRTHQEVPLSTEWIRAQYHWNLFASGLAHLEPTAILMAATFVLILTPILRVAVSIYAFSREGDGKFVTITSTVLGIVLLTVVLARAGFVSPEHVQVKDEPAVAAKQAP